MSIIVLLELMSKIPLSNDTLQYIVSENKYRYNILSLPNDDIINSMYKPIKNDIDKVIKTSTPLSYSNMFIRQNLLKEPFKEQHTYYLSKLRYDTYNSYCTTCKVYNRLLQYSTNLFRNSYVYHYIIAPYHNQIFDMTALNFMALKAMNRNISFTARYDYVTAYLIKYELSWTTRKDVLCLNPHCHIIYFIQSENHTDIMKNIDDYYIRYYQNYSDTKYLLVNNNDDDMHKIFSYFSKDPYKTIFKAKHSLQPSNTDIIAQLALLRNFRFYSSYKSLKNLFTNGDDI